MIFRRLLIDTRAASAAEFALILPILLLFLFGIIDAGRFMWEYNRAEKATMMGARFAVVTNVLDSGLEDENFVGQNVDGTVLTQGDRIPASALGVMRCKSDGCSCQEQPCPANGTFDSDAFGRIVTRMKAFKSDINPGNVVVDYSGSSLGFAGDPNGMELSPLVTVRLGLDDDPDTRLIFRPITTMVLPSLTIRMPSFRTSLTSEDAVGTKSE